ncbi:hypothetical protein BUMB_05307 [Candidatus Paraburkholderia calva]|nr:hypothetical protein BUMB_05307 [Candidatus Paraburkholderia calva]
MSRTTRSVVITLVVVLVVAALGFVYTSPYIVLDRVKRAADARDAQTVNQYVDFPALRTSLKKQVAALLTRRVDYPEDRQSARHHRCDDRRGSRGSAGGFVCDTGRRRGDFERHSAAWHARRASAAVASQRGQCGSAAPAPPVLPPVSDVTAQQAPPKQPPHTTTRYCNVNTSFVVTYQHGTGMHDTRQPSVAAA